MKKINVIITGGSGFIGKNLIEKIDLTVYKVSLVTRDKKKLDFVSNTEFNIVEADLSDVQSLKHVFQGQDVLLNLAAEVRNTNLLEKTNVQGTKNLVDAIVDSGIKKVIHLSSVGVVGMGYNSNSVVITEKTIAQPENEYERTKKISEDILVAAEKEFAFDLTILRPTNVFGENHPFNALLNLLQRTTQGKILPYTKGAIVNYVYVSDVSSSVLHFLNHDEKGIFQVGESMELKSFLELMQNSLNRKVRVLSVPKILIILVNMIGLKSLRGISNEVIYSDEKLKKYFHYPAGIEEGVLKTIEYYKKKSLI